MIDPKKKKILIILGIIVGVTIVVSIIVAIILKVSENSNNNSTQPTVTTYTDSYSGETITYTEGQVGERENAIVFFGFSKLLQYGMTGNQVSFLKEYINQYSTERQEHGNDKIKEVTIDYKTFRQILSEEVRGNTVEFTIVMNRDEKLRYKFSNSSVMTNELDTIIYSPEGEVVYNSKELTNHEH